MFIKEYEQSKEFNDNLKIFLSSGSINQVHILKVIRRRIACSLIQFLIGQEPVVESDGAYICF